MYLRMLKAKIHHARVTETRLEYQGSLTLDPQFMQAAGILPFEQVQVYNVDRGGRFETYVIQGQSGHREVIVNGAAVHLADVGDRLIVACYCLMDPASARKHLPRILLLGEGNEITALPEGRKSAFSGPHVGR